MFDYLTNIGFIANIPMSTEKRLNIEHQNSERTYKKKEH